MAKREFNQCLLYLFIGFMVLTGSLNTIAAKVEQNLSSRGRLFAEHQFFITFGMFIGEILSIFGYLYTRCTKKKDALIRIDDGDPGRASTESEPLKPEEGKEEINNCMFAISAFSDLCESTLNTFGLTYLASSVYQMFRGLELGFVMLFSKIFLGNPIYRHHLLGVGSVILGLFLVGLSAVLWGKQSSRDPVKGILFLVSAQFFSATTYTVQESFLTKYDINPFQLVGFEGIWGSLIYTTLLIIFQQIHCDSWGEALQSICFKNEYDEIVIEDTKFAFRQFRDNWQILAMQIVYIFSIATYNFVGINLTQLVSSTARAIVDTVRTVFVWAFFLVFPIVPDGTRESFNVVQTVGFVFLICGTLIYNEIVEIPWCNLNYYTRRLIKQRKSGDDEFTEKGDLYANKNLFDPNRDSNASSK
ncbi:MAG: hypothetical protein MJ252_24065 [archaeon]|nr:hypothetical protein [archaeon]